MASMATPTGGAVRGEIQGETRLARLLGSAVRISGDPDDEYFGSIRDLADVTDATHRCMSRIVRDPEAVCVDAGANIGVFTLALARLCPRGRVYSFEPSPTASRFLGQNVGLNGFGNVEIVQTALGITENGIAFHEVPTFVAGSYTATAAPPFGTGPAGSRVVEVPSSTLDGFCSRAGVGRVDFLKVDVEGAELAVLEGATRVLSSFRPVVLLEFNSFALCAFHQVAPFSFLQKIRQLFPFAYRVGRQDGALFPLESDEDWFQLLHLNLTGGAVDNLVGSFSRLREDASPPVGDGSGVADGIPPEGRPRRADGPARVPGPRVWTGDEAAEPQAVLTGLRLAIAEECIGRLAAERTSLADRADALDRRLRAIEGSRGWRLLTWIRKLLGRSW